MTHIGELRDVIHRLHKAKDSRAESVPVAETNRGQTVWEGIVEVFRLRGYPHTKKSMRGARHRRSGQPQAIFDRALRPARDLTGNRHTSNHRVACHEQLRRKGNREGPPARKAKSSIVAIRFNPEGRKRVQAAAKASSKTASQ
jgi:hypothetical protein